HTRPGHDARTHPGSAPANANTSDAGRSGAASSPRSKGQSSKDGGEPHDRLPLVPLRRLPNMRHTRRLDLPIVRSGLPRERPRLRELRTAKAQVKACGKPMNYNVGML